MDADKIVTDGKLDENMFEDPALVYVDLINEQYAEIDEDIMLGEASDIHLVDIVLRDDNEILKVFNEDITYNEVQVLN